MREYISEGRRLVLSNAVSLLVAVLAGIAGVASSYAVAGLTPSFIGGPIAGFLSRNMPDAALRFAITTLGDLGQQLNFAMALGIAVSVLAVGTLVGLAVGKRTDLPLGGAAVAAVLAVAVSLLVTGAPAASFGTGLGVVVVVLVAEAVATDWLPGFSPDRRRALGSLGSALAVGVSGYVLGAQGGTQGTTVDTARDVGNTEDVETTVSALREEADSKSLDVAGLEPLVSTGFYEVDINVTNPVVNADDWTLTVTGAVEEEVSYTYDEITGMTPENRMISLRCVGENLNGEKLDNAVWTGVPMVDLVEPAGLPDECCVMLHAVDDYYQEFPLAALEDGFLAYGMNGSTLPRGHGYPARALIPGHWGEINVKWLEEIEILAQEQDGYWEERGWHGTGPVNTVAKLHAENHLDDGRIEVAGHAYAGTRGIEQVEVSTDGGESWNEAALSEPLPGEDVWRQWVYRYDPPDGTHETVVRATDGTGDLQPQDRSGAFPSGATGWVSREIDP
jgi:DMSO/TMAO reductase YedYZ molybdopterin-dependent catalytic subunit